MKAEQRKRLEKNELAERLSRWWQAGNSGRSTSALWLSLGVGVLVLLLFFAWRYYRELSAKNQAAAWKQLELASSASDLEALMEAHRGTDVGRTAKAQLARVLLNEGLNQLASDLQRTRAIESIERARDLYRELSEETRGNDFLRREALLAAAKAEETLLSVPKGGQSDGVRGNLDQALESYNLVASQFPDSPEGRAAAERAKALRENRDKILSFYSELAKRFRTSDSIPTPNGFGDQGTKGGVGTGVPTPPLTPPLSSEPAPKSTPPSTPKPTEGPTLLAPLPSNPTPTASPPQAPTPTASPPSTPKEEIKPGKPEWATEAPKASDQPTGVPSEKPTTPPVKPEGK